ncbi:MAG: aminopeptidase P family protein [Actinobacteria bacterium]|nr:aminopeptidase P family protein [Actinomycetota bacterium]
MMSAAPYSQRLARVRTAMVEQSVDALLVSVGHDLPYLIGYHAMPLERLTALVVTASNATLVVPRLEAPRVEHHASVFDLVSWDETHDPIAVTAALLHDAKRIAVGDQMWSRFLVDLLRQLPGRDYVRSVEVVGALRASKDAAEIAALAAAGAAADRVAAQLQRGDIALAGRTEAAVSADISARLLAEGHDVVNFAIVAAGENASSPHHHPGRREIRRGEIVLCDFGGTMNGYCSDITRCVYLGEPPADVQRAWNDLRRAVHHVGLFVGFHTDAVTRAVDEVVAPTSIFKHAAGRRVDRLTRGTDNTGLHASFLCAT